VTDAALRKVQELADRHSVEVSPNYKDEWERGFDSGIQQMASWLTKILKEHS